MYKRQLLTLKPNKTNHNQLIETTTLSNNQINNYNIEHTYNKHTKLTNANTNKKLIQNVDAVVCVGLCLSAFAENPAVVTASPDSNEVVQTNTLTRLAISSAMPTKIAVIGPLRCLASEPK